MRTTSPFAVPTDPAKAAIIKADNTRRYWESIAHRIEEQDGSVRLVIAEMLQRLIPMGPSRGTPMYNNDLSCIPQEMLLAPLLTHSEEQELLEAKQFLDQIKSRRKGNPDLAAMSAQNDDWSPSDDIFDYDPADPDGEFAGISCYWADDGC